MSDTSPADSLLRVQALSAEIIDAKAHVEKEKTHFAALRLQNIRIERAAAMALLPKPRLV